MVLAGELRTVDLDWRQEGARAQAVEAAGIFDLNHAEAVVRGLELCAIALRLALGDELFVDHRGEWGPVDLAEVGEIFKLREKAGAPAEVGGVREQEHGGV